MVLGELCHVFIKHNDIYRILFQGKSKACLKIPSRSVKNLQSYEYAKVHPVAIFEKNPVTYIEDQGVLEKYSNG